MRGLKILFMSLMLFTGALPGNCQVPSAGVEPPNIILISIDTLRKDHLSCYGYHRETSPNIDALASRGTIFINDFSSSPWTLPSHTSMLTGLYPSFHGLQDDGAKLAPGITTLPELLSRHGYHTLAVTSHVYVSSEFGLEKGFALFDDSLIERGKLNPIAGPVADRAIQHMGNRPDRPYFLFVHFFDPHLNYEPPPPFDKKYTDPAYQGTVTGNTDTFQKFMGSRTPMPGPDLAHLTALYDGEIAYTDHQIGRMLDVFKTRGWLDNTVIIVTSDHGEEFKDHGQLGHPNSFFQEIINVPFIIVGCDRIKPGRRYDTISPVDILPTVLEITGTDIPPDIQGISLVSGARKASQLVYGETIRSGNEMRMVTSGDHKMIHGLQGNIMLFTDLRRDPKELAPIGTDPTDGVLTNALDQYSINADSGWHLKFISLNTRPLRCRGRIRTGGILVDPRKYYSTLMTKPSEVQFTRYEIGPDRTTLEFDMTMTMLMSEIVFDVDPPDSTVTFDIEIVSGESDAGVFLGTGNRVEGGKISLTRKDKRLKGLPVSYMKTPAGCYIRTVVDPRDDSSRTDLSDDAVDRLRALGYITDGR